MSKDAEILEGNANAVAGFVFRRDFPAFDRFVYLFGNPFSSGTHFGGRDVYGPEHGSILYRPCWVCYESGTGVIGVPKLGEGEPGDFTVLQFDVGSDIEKRDNPGNYFAQIALTGDQKGGMRCDAGCHHHVSPANYQRLYSLTREERDEWDRKSSQKVEPRRAPGLSEDPFGGFSNCHGDLMMVESLALFTTKCRKLMELYEWAKGKRD